MVPELPGVRGEDFMKQHRDGEENDVPFARNGMTDSSGTMDKPLDTADAPGKADSELIEEENGGGRYTGGASGGS
jgi:hypothetical protein